MPIQKSVSSSPPSSTLGLTPTPSVSARSTGSPGGPTMEVSHVRRLEKALGRPLSASVDPSRDVILLTEADLRQIRDAAVLQFIEAYSDVFAKYIHRDPDETWEGDDATVDGEDDDNVDGAASSVAPPSSRRTPAMGTMETFMTAVDDDGVEYRITLDASRSLALPCSALTPLDFSDDDGPDGAPPPPSSAAGDGSAATPPKAPQRRGTEPTMAQKFRRRQKVAVSDGERRPRAPLAGIPPLARSMWEMPQKKALTVQPGPATAAAAGGVVERQARRTLTDVEERRVQWILDREDWEEAIDGEGEVGGMRSEAAAEYDFVVGSGVRAQGYAARQGYVMSEETVRRMSELDEGLRRWGEIRGTLYEPSPPVTATLTEPRRGGSTKEIGNAYLREVQEERARRHAMNELNQRLAELYDAETRLATPPFSLQASYEGDAEPSAWLWPRDAPVPSASKIAELVADALREQSLLASDTERAALTTKPERWHILERLESSLSRVAKLQSDDRSYPEYQYLTDVPRNPLAAEDEEYEGALQELLE